MISFAEIIDQDQGQTLQKGHRVTLSFEASSGKWIRASQIAIIEWRIESHKDFRIISANYWSENYVSFEVEVMDTEALLTEQRIINYILDANPKGFTLILVPKIKAIAGDIADVALPFAGLAAAVIVIVLYLLLSGKIKS